MDFNLAMEEVMVDIPASEWKVVEVQVQRVGVRSYTASTFKRRTVEPEPTL